MGRHCTLILRYGTRGKRHPIAAGLDGERYHRPAVHNLGVDDVVAVEVSLSNGEARFFVTWGRIQDPVDSDPLCALILRESRNFALGAEPVRARVCGALGEAASSGKAPYFYECLLTFARQPIPFGDSYDEWRRERAAAMEAGREIAYCGAP